MELTDLLKGKMVNVMTDAKVVVQLEIHSVDLEPAIQANDWWPASRDWITSWISFP